MSKIALTNSSVNPSASRGAGGGYPLPVVLVDTREKRPLVFSHLDAVPCTLQTGDYSIKGYETDFAVERKSIPDLVRSLTHDRERFEKELQRLVGIGSRGFCRLLIVGTKCELLHELSMRKTTQNAIIGSLAAIDSDGVPVVWVPKPKKAAEWLESCAVYFYNRKRKQHSMPYKSPDWARAAVLDMIP